MQRDAVSAFGGMTVRWRSRSSCRKQRCSTLSCRSWRPPLRPRPARCLQRPEIRPWASLQQAEIVDLHHALAAVAHELKAPLQIEHLDAVTASGQPRAAAVGHPTRRRRTEPLREKTRRCCLNSRRIGNHRIEHRPPGVPPQERPGDQPTAIANLDQPVERNLLR